MTRDLKEFINDVLRMPGAYMPYYVSQQLAEWYPDSAILENNAGAFNLHEFAAAGQCQIWPQEPVHCQVKTSWSKRDDRFEHEIERGWLSILWTNPQTGKEHFLDVLYLTWTDGGFDTQRSWIIAEAQDVAEQFFRAVCAYCDEVHGEILVFEDNYWRKDDELFASIKKSTFDNLILPQQMKKELREDLRRFFASREIYETYGAPWKRGILLIGPPGNGKTHTIKALVNELGLPCLYVKSFKSSESVELSGMRAVFARARLSAPCLIVLEDLDALVADENRSYLLNELDGFASNQGVVVVASTNHPEKLDPAILERPSRFDRKFYFTLPAAPERLAYCRVWNQTLQPVLQLKEADLAPVVEATEGFSFAYLKELFLSGVMQWMVNQRPHTMGNILLERADILRDQLNAAKEAAQENAKDDQPEEAAPQRGAIAASGD